jgi:hypothetical protein
LLEVGGGSSEGDLALVVVLPYKGGPISCTCQIA